jgi:hypothetical protein
LTNINSLGGITSVGCDMSIINNDALPNIDSLSNFTSIGDYLSIQGNAALTDMNALGNITGLVGPYHVRDNPVLPTCQAQNILDHLKTYHEYSGGSQITGNDDTATCP